MLAAETLKDQIRACTLCEDRFAVSKTAHRPRPVVWFGQGARILIVGQAPGARVYQSGKPFTDRSGDRLRDWLGLDESTFYDQRRVAIVPMAFCFPGYDAKGSDLPPPKLCASEWRDRVLDAVGPVRLTLVIGGYAQNWHLGPMARRGVTETVSGWRDCPDGVLPLPHPSWRNTAWLKRNPWFEAELLPVLKARVAEALA
ncbi:MAG: uracil-DNA glycosylase family protein [Pseudomonadota bacterium]